MGGNRTFFGAIAASLVLPMAAAQSCGSDSGRGDPAILAACNNTAVAQCDYAAKCLPTFFSAQFTDVDNCVARVGLTCDGYATLPGSGWTAEKFDECSEHMRQATCTGIEGLGAGPCAYVPGSLPDDADCIDNFQCASGYCVHPSSGGSPSACGKCRDFGCVGKGCRPGESCSVATAAPRCVEIQAEGAACSSESVCATGLSCLRGLCTKSLGEGEACTVTTDCDRVQELACINNACHKPEVVDIGAPCTSATQCARGGACLVVPAAQSMACVAPIPDGQPCGGERTILCTAPARCASGVCRRPSELTCP